MLSIKIGRRSRATAALAALTLMASACDSFLEVENPNNLEAEAIDEERDRGLLTQSAYQALVASWGTLLVYDAWFNGEARVGDTFPTRNDFGRRDIPLTGENGARWNSLYGPVMQAETAIDRVEDLGDHIDLARAYFTAGLGYLTVGEKFCEGTVPVDSLTAGNRLTSAQVIDTAIVRLTRANALAKALTGTEATNITNASLMLIARAHLQNGRRTEASTFAAQVPANFIFNFIHFDDPNQRGRLGNQIWSFSESRISLVTPPEYRAMADAGDTRIAYVDAGRTAQDGILRFYRQAKIPGWSTGDRVASKLEADYIKLEADRDPAAIFAFVNARRAVGRQTALGATADLTVLMKELMEQKSRDFWLEGKRMADFRRLGDVVPYTLKPGPNYYKDPVAVGSQNCWPVPNDELLNNPNWK